MNRKKSFLHRLIIITILCTLLLYKYCINLPFFSNKTDRVVKFTKKTRPLLVQAQEPTDISTKRKVWKKDLHLTLQTSIPNES